MIHVSESMVVLSIRKYGSTFYIGIAMVVLPYKTEISVFTFNFHSI